MPTVLLGGMRGRGEERKREWGGGGGVAVSKATVTCNYFKVKVNEGGVKC